jgi:hypothetical protein
LGVRAHTYAAPASAAVTTAVVKNVRKEFIEFSLAERINLFRKALCGGAFEGFAENEDVKSVKGAGLNQLMVADE